MNSFSSASQICEPLPRTINGGSPPTEPKARTGEFTPPGIMLSARFCRRRDCSVLRDVMDGIESSRQGEIRCQPIEWQQPITIAALRSTNSSDIHASAISLQHTGSTVGSSRHPSNREGLKGSLGGSGLSFFLCCVWGRLLWPGPRGRSAAGLPPSCPLELNYA